MACSDNVIRAGLTPKFKDVETLCSVLIYEGGRMKVEKSKEEEGIIFYNTPVEEFVVRMIDLTQNKTVKYNSLGPSILIVTEGNGVAKGTKNSLDISSGNAYFISHSESISISSNSDRTLIFIASLNPSFYK